MGFTPEVRPLFVPDVDAPYEAAILVPGALTDEECDRAIEVGMRAEVESARVGARDDEVETVAETRRSKTAWIAFDDDTHWLYGALAAVAAEANEIYGFDVVGFTEDIQFTIYDEPEAFFDWHQDGLLGEIAVRKLSMVVQLSDPDDYDGADLEVFTVAHDATDPDWPDRARERGTAIVFPAFEHHRVTPMRSGTRHSLVCWIGGPPFR